MTEPAQIKSFVLFFLAVGIYPSIFPQTEINLPSRFLLLSGGDDCQQSFSLTEPVASGTYLGIQTSDWIIASDNISNEAFVHLRAKNSIQLNAGFNAESGSTFILEMGDCISAFSIFPRMNLEGYSYVIQIGFSCDG